jgi:2-C-methyl-D-erythritol 4-phosphate cytidylyltransferase
VLVRAHESEAEASDDAGLVEALGARVVVVEGEPYNFKITHLSDIDLLNVLERSRK